MSETEAETFDRLRAVSCLKNAHGSIAMAYAQLDGLPISPAHRSRAIRETLDAVDWIRRALESLAEPSNQDERQEAGDA